MVANPKAAIIGGSLEIGGYFTGNAAMSAKGAQINPQTKAMMNSYASTSFGKLAISNLEKTGMSKVSVTRALAKLEAKNLVLKERHGLTNKIKIKAD